MSFMNHPGFLRRVLLIDSATCAVMGAAMTGASVPIAAATGLPAALTLWVGLSLLPIAACNALIGMRAATPVWAVWLLIFGNAAWIVASLALVFILNGLTILGIGFVIAQALGVLILTELEIIGVRKLSRQGRIATA